MSEKENKIQSLTKMTNIMLGVIVVMAFFMGIMWQKLQALETGGATAKVSGNNVAATPQAPPVNANVKEVENIAQVSSISEKEEAGGEALGHMRGSTEAQVFLIEYSDFECPYCSRFHPTAQKLLDEYGDKVAWIYRHFPLDTIHPNARPTAEASECIFGQYGEDKFWEFADAVFAEGPTSLTNLDSIYADIGVDSLSIESCVENDTYADKVEADFKEGLQAGVTGTPGNFLISKEGETIVPLNGAVPYETLKAEVDKLLN